MSIYRESARPGDPAASRPALLTPRVARNIFFGTLVAIVCTTFLAIVIPAMHRQPRCVESVEHVWNGSVECGYGAVLSTLTIDGNVFARCTCPRGAR